MKIALPVAQGRLCLHFGHCEKFAVFEVDENSKSVTGNYDLDAPPHQPGLLPRWLSENGINCVIAGGMGSRAQGFFEEYKVKVIVGAPPEEPARIVEDYLGGKLVTSGNTCDH
ncbi:MAG TPA: ATPase [Spirochaetes bacterium]|nr:ATPase [Spirochaetota bacterium]